MRERQPWMVVIMLLVWTALYLVALRSARGQAVFCPGEHTIHAGESPVAGPSGITEPFRAVGHENNGSNVISGQVIAFNSSGRF